MSSLGDRSIEAGEMRTSTCDLGELRERMQAWLAGRLMAGWPTPRPPIGNASGHEPRDMEFYEMYAALRHGITMARVWHLRIHFGEQPMPDDPNDLVMHRAAIESMLDGRYWA